MTLPAVSAPIPEFSERAPSPVFQAASHPNSPAGLKLKKAAAEFESILLASLWKSVKGSFASADDSTDPAHDTLDDLGVQSMCSAVGKAGGLGLGKLILKHLEPMLPDSQNGIGP